MKIKDHDQMENFLYGYVVREETFATPSHSRHHKQVSGTIYHTVAFKPTSEKEIS